MKHSKKKWVKCSFCPRVFKRERARRLIRCAICLRKQKRAWYDEHAEERRAAEKARRIADPRVGEASRAWQKANPERMKVYRDRYLRREKQRLAELVASLPCLECGEKHSFENRAKVIRRMLPATVRDIREARPCFWGDPTDANSAGARRLYRDLEQLGALRFRCSFHLPTETRAAA